MSRTTMLHDETSLKNSVCPVWTYMSSDPYAWEWNSQCKFGVDTPHKTLTKPAEKFLIWNLQKDLLWRYFMHFLQRMN